MAITRPIDTQDEQFSRSDTADISWGAAIDVLEHAEMFWLTTVRPDGRPHITPLIPIRVGGTLYFGAGDTEHIARNQATNPHVALTTARDAGGLDLVIEGNAMRVIGRSALQAVADRYREKYGDAGRFTVGDDALHHTRPSPETGEPDKMLVFRIDPVTAFGFERGAAATQPHRRF